MMLRYHVHLCYYFVVVVAALIVFSASSHFYDTNTNSFNNNNNKKHNINIDNDNVNVNVNKLNQIPTYYIDLNVLDIVKRRINCLLNSSLTSHVLHTLKQQSATEFYRSHELYAYNFFVESIDNPYRRFNYDDADLEYIPLLPLHWLHAYDTNSKNDNNNNNNNNNLRCGGYNSFIQDIISIQEYFRERDNSFNNNNNNNNSSSSSSSTSKVISKFTVASTYNLRTAIGVGMPTQIRRGYAWTTVSDFIMSLSLGHYERWPQCPDLLRKTFKYTIELPYVSMTTKTMMTTSDIKATNSDIVFDKDIDGDDDDDDDDKLIKKIRPYLFHFSGNFELFGPELICSVRNSIIDISKRTDVLSINVTQKYAKSVGVNKKLMQIIINSTFCLITKGDSYSTSFFYHAIQLGCIPIVISDWFVFSFPWMIPYHKFILRVSENDFLKNSHYVLDYIKSSIGMNNKLLVAMRINMMKYKRLLSYDRILLHSIRHKEMLRLDQYYNERNDDNNNNNNNNNNNEVKSNNQNRTINFRTILPMELLLLEMKYTQYPHQYYNNVPCTRPNRCSDDPYHHSYRNENHSDHQVRSSRQRLNNITDYQFIDSKQKQPSHLPMYLSNFTTTVDPITTDDMLYPVYKVKNDGYQVNPLSIPPTISNVFNTNYDIINNFNDIRSHLCRHNTRLIGMYKMVYYMQCVRILWPLQPGKFKPVDNIAGRFIYSYTDNKYYTIEHGNSSSVLNPDISSSRSSSSSNSNGRSKHRGKLSKSSSLIYRNDPNGISIQDILFVTAYHDANQSKYMALTNYPIDSESLDHIYQLYSSRISNKVKILELD